MDLQLAFNVVVAISAFLGGWVLNSFKDSVKGLQAADTDLAIKVQGIEVLVAGQYVKRDELEKLGSAIFTKLDRIEGKLDGKADKQ